MTSTPAPYVDCSGCGHERQYHDVSCMKFDCPCKGFVTPAPGEPKEEGKGPRCPECGYCDILPIEDSPTDRPVAANKTMGFARVEQNKDWPVFFICMIDGKMVDSVNPLAHEATREADRINAAVSRLLAEERRKALEEAAAIAASAGGGPCDCGNQIAKALRALAPKGE